LLYRLLGPPLTAVGGHRLPSRPRCLLLPDVPDFVMGHSRAALMSPPCSQHLSLPLHKDDTLRNPEMLCTSIAAVWRRSTRCITRSPDVDPRGDSQRERWCWFGTAPGGCPYYLCPRVRRHLHSQSRSPDVCQYLLNSLLDTTHCLSIDSGTLQLELLSPLKFTKCSQCGCGPFSGEGMKTHRAPPAAIRPPLGL
jgi:hypothetical protein